MEENKKLAKKYSKAFDEAKKAMAAAAKAEAKLNHVREMAKTHHKNEKVKNGFKKEMGKFIEKNAKHLVK